LAFEHHRKFISRRARATVAEREALAQDTEEALQKKAQQIEDRRKESHDLVAQTIRRELAESISIRFYDVFLLTS
jgi:microfibrillar-associated protein 1